MRVKCENSYQVEGPLSRILLRAPGRPGSALSTALLLDYLWTEPDITISHKFSYQQNNNFLSVLQLPQEVADFPAAFPEVADPPKPVIYTQRGRVWENKSMGQHLAKREPPSVSKGSSTVSEHNPTDSPESQDEVF
ncbi:hypothetical protein QQF64_009504, partial [Cirrhinus molitorella]